MLPPDQSSPSRKAYFTVKLPTKPHLRKYLQATGGHPMELNYRSTLGVIVLCVLSKDYFSINMNVKKKEYRMDGFTDQVTFSIPISTMPYKGHTLSQDKIIAINRYLEDVFVQDLYQYCRAAVKDSGSWRPGIDKAIYSFAEALGIEIDTDISFDALKKSEWRCRKKMLEKLQTFVPQPSTPLRSSPSSSYMPVPMFI